MPWKETCAMTERFKFVALAEADEETMAALCRRFGISRKTGYKLLGRYAEEGVAGLGERSHAAHHHLHAVSEAIERRIVELRGEHPFWGPRKLRARLRMLDAAAAWPAASTIGEILQRHGLVVPRRRRPRAPGDVSPFAACVDANETWCIDFKGWFRTGDGRRCEPLTVSDAHTRFLLRCQAVRRANTRCVQPLLEATFCEYGLPRVIRSDNGPPFASCSAGGLSQLSVWWIKLGIRPERISLGRPCENGRHERLHGTLKLEACQPPAANRRAQQQRFDAFRRIYNEQRPHEALADATPSMIYRPSPRPYPARLAEVVYPDGWQVRRVRPDGSIKWGGEHLFISEVLAGEPVGLQETDDGPWCLHFGPVVLGSVRAGKVHRTGARRRGRVALRSPMAPRDAPAPAEPV
jgi:putative transposase